MATRPEEEHVLADERHVGDGADFCPSRGDGLVEELVKGGLTRLRCRIFSSFGVSLVQ